MFNYTCVCICIIHLYFLCHYAKKNTLGRANVSILTCMHDCNFAGEDCVLLISTLLWTCPQNHGHMDELNLGSISCYFMLQITYLGVYKCILGTCVMFLHTSHMYFRLQPVCSASLCSVGFANVDIF